MLIVVLVAYMIGILLCLGGIVSILIDIQSKLEELRKNQPIRVVWRNSDDEL